jgi:hypothetical protein
MPAQPPTPAPDPLHRTTSDEITVTETTERPRPLGLSLTQIAGGALAAVTATVFASFFGVAGTVTGAALGSVVSSIGAAVYSTSLSRAARASRLLVVRTGGLDADDPAAVPPPLTATPEVVAVAEATPDAASPATGRPTWAAIASHLHWKPILVVAGLIFVIAMAVVYVTEVALGHPLSNPSGSGTTISDLTGSGSSGSTPTPTRPSATTVPSATSSADSSAGPSPTDTGATPSASSSGIAPSPTAMGSGGVGSPAPTTEPTSSAPAPAPTTPAGGPTGPGGQ